ncbi:PAS domain S-box protein [aff. Roholtiella sp. LEGE 12411]|uniref:PAS domain S-box protein n=1 Tax=aff. Roholtiella sp. LEGE 12411 TaxID=1828822 RepID=UPI00187DEB66|nr:PAS domain S-box protein [aff. Roholtiella sp. LEGE 12411]MBE9038428.1 PAS domain S-box protein [aff. Roholtiella sp. LEGE 12411]
MRFKDQLIDLPTLYDVIDRSPLTISPDSYVGEAIVLMSQERSSNYGLANSDSSSDSSLWSQQVTGCILVVERSQLLGILTEKDVVKLTSCHEDLSQVKMSEVMSQQVITLTQSDSQDIFTALSLFRQHRIRYLPILDSKKQLVGIVTETSLLHAFDLVKMVGAIEGLHQYLQKPTDEKLHPQGEVTNAQYPIPQVSVQPSPNANEGTQFPADFQELRYVNQQIEKVRRQTHNYLQELVQEQSAQATQINEELQQTLEELKVVEEELRQQNEELSATRQKVESQRQRYQDLFEFAPDGYLVTDAVGIIQEANHAAATLLCVRQKYLRGKPLVLFIAQQDHSTFVAQLNNVLQVQEWEICLQPRRGVPFPASIRLAAVCNSQGQRVGWRWLICDITVRKQAEEVLRQATEELERRVAERTAELVVSNMLLQQEIAERQRVEEALRQSEQLYRQLVETQIDMIIRIDLQGQITFANTAACKILGRQLDELRDQSLSQFLHPDELHHFRQYITAITSPPYCLTIKQRTFTANGIGWFEWKLTAIKDETEKVFEVQGIGRDITERKQMEEALQESEERYRSVVTAMQEGVVLLEADDCRIIACNTSAERILGLAADEIIGRTLEDSFLQALYEDGSPFPIEDHPTLVTLRTGKPCSNVIMGIYKPNGQLAWISINSQPLFQDHNPIPYAVVASFSDISDRKQAEQKIYEQAALLDIATDAILVRDFKSEILFWNKGAERLYGWQATEAVGKNLQELLYKKTSPQLEMALTNVVEYGSWQGELNKFTKSGQEIIVESRWTLMRDAVGEPKSILSVDTDITEKKQLQAQSFRTQRLESLGTLAGGIAHDLNNILTPILAAAQLVQGRFALDEERSGQLLALVESNAKRGAALVKQVLSFARGFKGEHTIIQVKHLILEITQIAQQTFPKSIEFSTDISEDLWTVSGDITQLHQVLMNLVVNARDAMPNGGNIKIDAKNKFIDDAYTKMNLEATVGPHIVITVADTGMGMPPFVLDRIFEPFFTTKDISTGTGLGLSTVLGIIKSHGGFIKVFSPGVEQGSQFQLFLPAVIAIQALSTENLDMPQGQGELILVVDDEAQIREVATIILNNYNYKSLTASNGIEAIALYAQHKYKINTVIMDMMMPEMDGITAIRTLQKMNPQVQIIACSGLNSTEFFTKAAGPDVQAFLSKPYTARELLTSLHQILRGTGELEKIIINDK